MATQIKSGWVIDPAKDRIVSFDTELAPEGSDHSIKLSLKKSGGANKIVLTIVQKGGQPTELDVDPKIPPGTGA